MIEFDALKDVTDKENTVREDNFEIFADMTGPSPNAASERALCMQIFFILQSD